MIIVPRPWVRALIILAATGLVAHCSRTETETFPILSGPYLGQMPPGKEAQIFAPDIVAIQMMTFSAVDAYQCACTAKKVNPEIYVVVA